DKNVNAARPKAVVNTARPKAVVNAGNPQMDLQDQRVIDSGCSSVGIKSLLNAASITAAHIRVNAA
ncbi:hypothetical protein Tco_1481011, partial [Tanacetum coccineum]